MKNILTREELNEEVSYKPEDFATSDGLFKRVKRILDKLGQPVDGKHKGTYIYKTTEDISAEMTRTLGEPKKTAEGTMWVFRPIDKGPRWLDGVEVIKDKNHVILSKLYSNIR